MQLQVLDDLKSYEGSSNRGFMWRQFFGFFPFPSGGKDSNEVFDVSLISQQILK